MNIHRFYHVIQDSGRQLVQIEILPYLVDKPVNVFCLFFLLYNFFVQLQQLFPQFFLLLLIIVREHLKPAVGKFPVGVIFVNTLEKSVKFFYAPFRLRQLPPLLREFFFRFGFLLCAHSRPKAFLMGRRTGNHKPHMGEYALFQHNGADKVSRANLFPFQS